MRRPAPPSLIACRTFSAVSCALQKNISGPTQKIDVEVLQAAKVWFGGRGRESLEELVRQGCVCRGVRNGGADLLRGDTRTVDEEQMGAGILLSPTGEIADDTVDVGRSGHEDVHRVEAWLCLAVARYGFDDWVLGV